MSRKKVYTESKDGIMRTSFIAELRVTKKEEEDLRKIARHNEQTVKQYLDSILAMMFDSELDYNRDNGVIE